jgi:hypothetical protein
MGCLPGAPILCGSAGRRPAVFGGPPNTSISISFFAGRGADKLHEPCGSTGILPVWTGNTQAGCLCYYASFNSGHLQQIEQLWLAGE